MTTAKRAGPAEAAYSNNSISICQADSANAGHFAILTTFAVISDYPCMRSNSVMKSTSALTPSSGMAL
jgi:hypothetical protein